MTDTLHTDKSTYYEILGLPTTATAKEIKKGYRRGALRWHPDKNTDNQTVAEEQFKLVARAWSVLSDAEQKRDYDRFGHEQSSSSSSGGGGGQRNPFGGGRNPFGGGGRDIDPNEIFRAFFQNAGGGGGGGSVQFQSFSFGGGGGQQFGGGGGGGINQLFQRMHQQQQQQRAMHHRGRTNGQVQTSGFPTETMGGVHSFDCGFLVKLILFCYIINFLFFS